MIKTSGQIVHGISFAALLNFSLSIGCTSTEKGDCCVFPFKYNGKYYDSCSFVDSSKPWCSLTSDFDKDKKFGYCAFKSKYKIQSRDRFCPYPC